MASIAGGQTEITSGVNSNNEIPCKAENNKGETASFELSRTVSAKDIYAARKVVLARELRGRRGPYQIDIEIITINRDMSADAYIWAGELGINEE